MSSIDMTPENTYIVSYPNDMLDGILWEDETNFAFISAHTEGYRELLDRLDSIGVQSFCIDTEVDYTEAPHCWVVNAVTKLVIQSAEVCLG